MAIEEVVAGQVFKGRRTSLRADSASQVFARSGTAPEDKGAGHRPGGDRKAGHAFKTGVRARARRRVRFPSASAWRERGVVVESESSTPSPRTHHSDRLLLTRSWGSRRHADATKESRGIHRRGPVAGASPESSSLVSASLFAGVRPRGNVHLVALGIGERPPLWRVCVAGDAATGSHGRIDAGLCLVLGQVQIDVDAVALRSRSVQLLEPEGWPLELRVDQHVSDLHVPEDGPPRTASRQG